MSETKTQLLKYIVAFYILLYLFCMFCIFGVLYFHPQLDKVRGSQYIGLSQESALLKVGHK